MEFGFEEFFLFCPDFMFPFALLELGEDLVSVDDAIADSFVFEFEGGDFVFGGEDLGFDLFDLPVEGLLGREGFGLDFESVVLLAHHAEDKGVILDLLLPNFSKFLRLSVRNNPFT